MPDTSGKFCFTRATPTYTRTHVQDFFFSFSFLAAALTFFTRFSSDYSIKVVSKAFEGKNTINRQRLVYKCIWEEMQTDKVHAVQAIETKTPDE